MSLESDTGIGRNKDTAQTVAGGTALATIVGVIARGEKDAAVGGIVSDGDGIQVLTRGRHVRVPPDTLLTFRLEKPVTLQSAR